MIRHIPVNLLFIPHSIYFAVVVAPCTPADIQFVRHYHMSSFILRFHLFVSLYFHVNPCLLSSWLLAFKAYSSSD